MKDGKKILLVDDDDALRVTLSEQLEAEFDVSQARTGSEALSRAASDLHDIIVLDVGLPDADGRDVCRQLRQMGVRTPVIMLTAADSEADTIRGLDSGANDYVSKPFRIGVLLARIRAQLRQYERSEDAIFAIGPYSFRPSAKLMVHKETKKKVRLTEKEASILKYLLRAGSIVIGRDVLLNEVWGYNSGVTTHTLETHVYRLRQKIERDPSKAALLVTEQGGYRLIP
jgi:DNA-binding response OmpR family regulator